MDNNQEYDQVDHILNIDSKSYKDIVILDKTFTICYDNIDYKINDLLCLKEIKKEKPLEYTGNEAYFKISYIMRGPIEGLLDSWMIISLVEY